MRDDAHRWRESRARSPQSDCFRRRVKRPRDRIPDHHPRRAIAFAHDHRLPIGQITRATLNFILELRHSDIRSQCPYSRTSMYLPCSPFARVFPDGAREGDEAVRFGKARVGTCMRTLSRCLCFGGYGGTETLPPPYYRYHHHHHGPLPPLP